LTIAYPVLKVSAIKVNDIPAAQADTLSAKKK
jgi:hypothetical protein